MRWRPGLCKVGEAAEILRKCGFNKPIIAVTASVLPDDRENCFRAGIDDILMKPFKRIDLERILRKWINVRQDTVFDAAALLNTFMDNREMVLSLLPRFITRTQAQLESIPDLKKAGDWQTAYREAHTIKGAAFTMSGEELGKAAARLELAFKNIDRNEMETAFPPLEEAFHRFRKAAEEFCRSGT